MHVFIIFQSAHIVSCIYLSYSILSSKDFQMSLFEMVTIHIYLVGLVKTNTGTSQNATIIYHH